jgi:putative MATE family efflux protein
MAKSNYDRMINTSIPKLISFLALPTIISMLVSAIYNMADTFFVTKLGDSPSAAISIVFSLQTLIQAIGFTIGMGCGSMISRSLGNKDEKLASIYASSSMVLALAFGLIFSIIGVIFNSQLMSLLGASETSKPYAMEYGFWISLSAPFMMMSFVMNNILRSEGKAILSMVGLGIGNILNIGLDPLFISVFGLGVFGAGLSTFLSMVTSFIILLIFFLIGKTQSKFNVRYISKDIKIYWTAFRCGMPTLFRQGTSTISNTTLNFLAKPYGDPVVAALGIANKLYMLIRSLVIGIGQGYQPVLGFSYGAKKYDRIRKAFWFTLSLQTAICLIATIVTVSMPNVLMGIFTDSEEIVQIGVFAVRVIAIGLPLLGFSTIVNQSLQVTGYSYSASFLATLRQGLVYIPCVFLLDLWWKANGLALTQPISDLLTALITIPFFFYFFNILKRKENEHKNEMNGSL